MSNLTIFKNPGALAKAPLRQSAMGQQIAESMGGYNRIQTNTNGTFKRIVNGEQVGKAIRGEFNAIIVAMLPRPSREYYASAYDPDAKATLPDCWSSLGDKPEAKAGNKQASNCTSCPQNIDGSGQNGKGKACRFKRKVALLLEGDDSGDLYQFNIPAKSLFGKGDGNTHPFESYSRFLVANGTAPDMVVTTIAYNLDSDTMELNFTPVRPITDDEYELVVAAQADPKTQRLIQISAGDADGAKPKAAAPVQDDEDEEEAPAPKATKPKRVVVEDDEDEEDEEEAPAPKVTKRTTKKEEPAKLSKDLAAVVNAWADDDEDD